MYITNIALILLICYFSHSLAWRLLLFGISLIRGVEEGVVLGLIGFIFTVMAIKWLVKRYKQEYPNNKKFHWKDFNIMDDSFIDSAKRLIGVWLFFFRFR